MFRLTEGTFQLTAGTSLTFWITEHTLSTFRLTEGILQEHVCALLKKALSELKH